MTYRYLGKSLRNCGHLAVILSAAALFGCEGKVIEAGDAEDTDDSNEGDGDTSEQTTTSQTQDPDPSCSDEDAAASASYENWLVLDNDFEDAAVNLLGKTFQGYIEGGDDITLQIAADGSATFFVDELVDLPAPIKDKGYLCSPLLPETQDFCFDTPMVGIPYEIRGATLTNGRLVVPIQEHSPYDPWCQLQTPILYRDEEPCVFALIRSEGGTFSPSTNTCTIGGRAYDCSWLDTAMWPASFCECTSSACFAAIRANPSLKLDVRIGDVAGEISGSLAYGDQTTPVHLFEVIR